nr:glycoside hydrolase family 2 protein [Lachnospiraceae bacterium]
YQRYVGNWGGESTAFKFEAIKDGEVVKTVVKSTMTSIHLEADIDHTELKESDTYDVAAIRIKVLDNNGNIATYYNQPVSVKVKGPAEIIGPKFAYIGGGMGGTYIKTTGEAGEISIKISMIDGIKSEIKLKANVSV